MNAPHQSSTPVVRATDKRAYSRKSTATEAQYERIIIMLRSGPKNTLEFRRAGVLAPAARIKEMNDRWGAYIPTVSLVTITDEHGFPHRGIAVYELIDEPVFSMKVGVQ